MRVLSILFIATAVFTFTSCEKWKKEKDDASYYYSTDFKEAQGTIMGVEIAEIDHLYTVFFYEGKDLKYKLVAEKNGQESEKGDVLAYEFGSADVDESYNILYSPTLNGSTDYSGAFDTKEKKKFTVTLPGLDSRELHFILKKK
jgi:hypothetical protein